MMSAKHFIKIQRFDKKITKSMFFFIPKHKLKLNTNVGNKKVELEYSMQIQ